MFIEAFKISSYKSFSHEPQSIGPFGKINIFIGKNNSGKSNIVHFIKNCYGPLILSAKNHRPSNIQIIETDLHVGNSTNVKTYGFGLKKNGQSFKQHLENLEKNFTRSQSREIVQKILNSEVFLDEVGIFWSDYQCSQFNQPLEMSKESILSASKILKPDEWNHLWSVLTKQTGGGLEAHWVPETLRVISPVTVLQAPKVDVIPAVRKLGEPNSSPDDYSGIGIIDKLARLQNPSINDIKNRQKFKSINKFVKSVLRNDSCEIEIPYQRDVIIIHMDGKTLPIHSLGTGLHELIIIAAAATILEQQVVCIEEPELHLHPALHKQLIMYLVSATSNQYFITSHSAHILDIPESNVFHVLNEGEDINKKTKIKLVYSPSCMFDICKDLGYKASDIMQSNCVIWVEGPSDRIYLNYFLGLVSKELTEGVHYSIMFYGGKLLSHLSGEDAEVKEFISLKRLNRNMIVLIDSDKSSSDEEINDTKTRIKEEFEKNSGLCWITSGKEIENYIQPQIFAQAIEEIYSSSFTIKGDDQYHSYFNKKNFSAEINKDKVKIARKILEYNPALNRLDLKERLEELVRYIQDANS